MRKRGDRGRNPGAAAESEARSFELWSRVSGPIEQMERLERSALFAELSMVSYLPHEDAGPILRRIGFCDVQFIEHDDAEAYVVRADADVVVVCRGTEPTEWNDIKADVSAWTEFAEPFGRVHRGFKREVDDILPRLVELLADERRSVWFTGHSLGGAMATICAVRCKLSASDLPLREIVTFGSPRVGTHNFLKHVDVSHVRWVNHNDIVTRMPPTWLRFRHTGILMYIDRDGYVRSPAFERRRVGDRLPGVVAGVRRRRFDHFSDHAIRNYVDHVARAAGRDH